MTTRKTLVIGPNCLLNCRVRHGSIASVVSVKSCTLLVSVAYDSNVLYCCFDYSICDALKFGPKGVQSNGREQVSPQLCPLKPCFLHTNCSLPIFQTAEPFDGWEWKNLGHLESVGTIWSGTTQF